MVDIYDLPHDCIRHIFKKLSIAEIHICASVCRAWNIIATNIISHWSSLVLQSPPRRPSFLNSPLFRTVHSFGTITVKYIYKTSRQVYEPDRQLWPYIENKHLSPMTSLNRMVHLTHLTLLLEEKPMPLVDQLVNSNSLSIKSLTVNSSCLVPNVLLPSLKQLTILNAIYDTPLFQCPSLEELVMPHIAAFRSDHDKYPRLVTFMRGLPLQQLKLVHFTCSSPGHKRGIGNILMLELIMHIVSHLKSVTELDLNLTWFPDNFGGMEPLVRNIQWSLLQLKALKKLSIYYHPSNALSTNVLDFESGFFTRFIGQNKMLSVLKLKSCKISRSDIEIMKERSLM